MAHSDRSSAKNRRPKAAREIREQTKFDKWLEECAFKSQTTILVLDPSPFATDTLNEVPARILVVDRYMICVEFQEYINDEGVRNTYDKGNIWWIPKDSIKGAAPSASL
jgi:hypothetical protein